MRGSTNPSRTVDTDADVTLSARLGLSAVQAHPDPDLGAIWPMAHRQLSLRRRRRRDRIPRRTKGGEEGIALSVDDLTTMSGEGSSQDLSVFSEDVLVSVAPKLLEQARRALDVSEQEGDRPGREPGHVTASINDHRCA
jgi:hypothetical protein